MLTFLLSSEVALLLGFETKFCKGMYRMFLKKDNYNFMFKENEKIYTNMGPSTLLL
jgi:hypothetical protein